MLAGTASESDATRGGTVEPSRTTKLVSGRHGR